MLFSALDLAEQLGDVGAMGLIDEYWRLVGFGNYLLNMFQSNGEWPCQQQDLPHHILQLAHVARPRLLLQKSDGGGLNGGCLDAQFLRVAANKELYELRDVLRTL